MDRQGSLQKMIENYTRKRALSVDGSTMQFHHKHLALFLNRFAQLVSHFRTPSSSLLNHEMFLVVEAATTVARDDWEKCSSNDAEHYSFFPFYFSAFEALKKGQVPLDAGTSACLQALTVGEGF